MKAREGTPTEMQDKRVLLVDDEQHIVDVVVYILEENAFEVISHLRTGSG